MHLAHRAPTAVGSMSWIVPQLMQLTWTRTLERCGGSITCCTDVLSLGLRKKSTYG
jgi:hypothetical protein